MGPARPRIGLALPRPPQFREQRQIHTMIQCSKLERPLPDTGIRLQLPEGCSRQCLPTWATSETMLAGFSGSCLQRRYLAEVPGAV
jgi:hypothetical protein